jgi:autotransporter-associated beta strand protein
LKRREVRVLTYFSVDKAWSFMSVDNGIGKFKIKYRIIGGVSLSAFCFIFPVRYAFGDIIAPNKEEFKVDYTYTGNADSGLNADFYGYYSVDVYPGVTVKTNKTIYQFSGQLKYIKNGDGTIVYTNFMETGGLATLNAGTVALGRDNVWAFSPSFDIKAPATFDLNDFNETIGALSGAGTVDLGSGTLTFGDTTSTTFSGDVTGTGHLTKAGSGTTTLSGTASHTGGTTISAGTLALGGSDLLADTGAVAVTGTGVFDLAGFNETIGALSGDGTVTLGAGALTFGDSTDATFSGSITGAGSVTKAGSGTTILSGSNTYLGGTTLSSGTLQIGDGGTMGSITGDVVNNATLAFNRSDAVGFSGAISGTGGLVQAGSGILSLTGSNTYSGGTTLSSGTLQVGTGGTTGSITGDVVNNATLAFNRSDAVGFSGAISGTGGLVQAGSGTLTLSGTASHTGGTTISAGTLALGAANRLSDTGAVTVGTGSTFDLGGFSETIGALAGGGTVALGAGALTFGDGTNTAFSGGITGAGRVTKAGSGTITLSGTASHTGGTTISAGTLALGASDRLSDTGAVMVSTGGTFDLGGFVETVGSLTGGGTVALGTGTLTFGDTGAGTFSGGFTGAGSLVKQGTGTWTYTGSSPAMGATTVTGGKLVVNGTMGAVTLASGTTLGGSGTVGTVVASGTVAPGNSIGTLSTGNVTFKTGSTYHVEINAAGQSDRVDATGTATIESGASVEVDPEAGTYGDNLTYTILTTTGGITGSFDGLGYTTGNTLFHNLSLVTAGNDLLLRLTRNNTSFSGAVDPDLSGTGAGLDELERLVPGASRDILQALYDLEDDDALNTAVAQLSGASAWPSGLGYRIGSAMVGAASGGVGATRMGGGGGGSRFAGLAQVARGESGGMGLLETVGQTLLSDGAEQDSRMALAGDTLPGQPSDRARVWFATIGGFGERDADGVIPGQTHSYWGFAGGYRHPLGKDWEAGLATAFASSDVTSGDGLSTREGRSILGLAQLQWTPGDWTVEGGLGVARHAFDSERRVLFPGFDATATGAAVSWEGIANLDGRYDWTTDWGVISPAGGLSLSVTREGSWTESGGGSANLTYESQVDVRAQSHLGVGFAKPLDLGDGFALTPSVEALWVANLGQLKSGQDARFSNGSVSWAIPSLEESRHSGVARVELDLASAGGWSVGLGYAGRFAEGARDHAFRIGGKLEF